MVTGFEGSVSQSSYETKLCIQDENTTNEHITELMNAKLNPISSKLKKATIEYEVKNGILYNKGRIEVPNDNHFKYLIVKSQHDSLLAGHPGRAETLSLIKRCFSWPLLKSYVNRYVDGCDSCLRVKSTTQKPLRSLEPLPIPAGPWTDISYDLITKLQESNGFDSILTVVDRLTKMSHFIP